MQTKQSQSIIALLLSTLLLTSVAIATENDAEPTIDDQSMSDFDQTIYDYSYKSCLLAGENVEGVKEHCQCSANVALQFIRDAELDEDDKDFYAPIYTQEIIVEDLDDEAYERYESISGRIILDYSNRAFMQGITDCYYQHIGDPDENPLATDNNNDDQSSATKDSQSAAQVEEATMDEE